MICYAECFRVRHSVNADSTPVWSNRIKHTNNGIHYAIAMYIIRALRTHEKLPQRTKAYYQHVSAHSGIENRIIQCDCTAVFASVR